MIKNNYMELYSLPLDDLINENNQLELSLFKDNLFTYNRIKYLPTFEENSSFFLSRDFYEINRSQEGETKLLNILENIDNSSENLSIPKKNQKKNEKNNYENNMPTHYTFNKIKELIQTFDLPSKVKDSIVMDSNLNTIDNKMSDKKFLAKKKRRNNKNIKFTENPESQKIGRKKLDDFSKRKHDRNSPDNIIKKIKLKILEYALKFLNNILKSYLSKNKFIECNNLIRKAKKKEEEIEIEKENLLKFIYYKFVNKIKKETDLILLNTPLKEIFSNDISPKYSTISRDSNRKIIKRILKEEKDNINIMFAFNLTLKEWLDIFTYKKN